MKKADYDIDLGMSKANRLAAERWARARERKRESHSIYDIRCNLKDRKHFPLWLTNKDLERWFVSEYDDVPWSEKLSGFEVFCFEGFVNRIMQQKDSAYYVEIKSLDGEVFDIEHGWYGFWGLNPIIPSATKMYRYMFQPFIPGNCVRVQYLKLNQPDTKHKTKKELHVEVENNEYSEGA